MGSGSGGDSPQVKKKGGRSWDPSVGAGKLDKLLDRCTDRPEDAPGDTFAALWKS